MRLLLICVLLALNGSMEEKKMDEKIQHLITQAAHQELGWKTDEVRVDEIDRLRRHSCSFYTAGHKVRPISYQLNYALVSGDQIVGSGNQNAAAKILDACGGDAPASWWAEIVTRFHPDLVPGIVLQDPSTNRAATRRIEAAKKEFKAPAFSNESGGKTISYYLLDPESNLLYFVIAKKNSDGSITVERNELDEVQPSNL
jgi:hypothetical protein